MRGHAVIVGGFGRVTFEVAGAAVGRGGHVGPVGFLQGKSKRVLDLGVFGVELEGATVRDDRLVAPARCVQGGTEIVVSRRIIGLEFDRSAVRDEAAFVAAGPLHVQGNAQIVVGLGRAGRELDGSPEGGDRFVEPALLAESSAESIVRFHQVRRELDDAAIAGDRLVAPARRVQDDAKQVQRLDMIGQLGKDLAAVIPSASIGRPA